ncbi:MAG: alanine--tRNA ligase [Candidatus Micrarchaeota archaeon]|nr:alanine--tRNA ligase [Candidatus Micrarchaeota archaeon]
MDKQQLRFLYNKEWKKHYDLEVFKEYGFQRRQCKKCGRYFWSVEERDLCGDPACVGYQFIGEPIGKKRGYVETWKAIEQYFVSTGHTSIKPYPTVARWRDDLYFTIASINDFQPYVVSGELDPPANPLIVPQPSIRFSDIDNVGVTGRHYTNFVMIGQHAFNKDKLFYWKNEAIEHDINYLTKVLGIPLNEIVFHEDVWMGGGNFGPSLEYFVRGLELGNCVFMQYEITEDGYRELKTKVIDMGAGLSRLAWITSGAPMSYEIVFEKPYLYLTKLNPLEVDQESYLRYAKIAGGLNVDEATPEEINRLLSGFTEEELKAFERLRAMFSILDHTSTLLFTIRDGMMPSNAGGGYNLRLIARRMFAFEETYGIEYDLHRLLELHIENWKGLFDEYGEAVDVVAEVIEEERKKYKKTKERAQRLIKKLKGKKLTTQDLVRLYQSEGINPELLKKELNIEIPPNFYDLVRQKDEVKKKQVQRTLNYPETKKYYYDNKEEFEATVIGIEEDGIVLDKTYFYPEGGGQVGDQGYIEDEFVYDTKKYGNVVLHLVKNPKRFSVGQRVKAKVDLARRKRITKHHTAAHLLTKAAYEILGPHVWQAGAKKEETKAHMDLTHYKRITDEELERIERRVNEKIMEALPIEIEVMPRTAAEQKHGFRIYQGGAVPGKILRIVNIGGYDAEACGGTHNMLKHTGEIGFFKIVKRESVQDGVQRIVYKVGEAALDYIQERERKERAAAKELSIEPELLPETALKFFHLWKDEKKAKEALIAHIKKEIEESEQLEYNLPFLTLREFGGFNPKHDKIVRLKDGMLIGGPNKDEIVKRLGVEAKGKHYYIVRDSPKEKEGSSPKE